jgi:7,8-dihydropterin-6-yl-methyl-4-(beta-D-ribofuranosyl)aminobenzene 5'-phosphate synthase
MKKYFYLIIALSIFFPFWANSQEKLIDPESITFSILYNDISANDSIIGDQGFSCLVEMPGHSFLFDAGRIEEHLENNAEQMKTNYGDVDFIFISHLHSDHVGGLPGIANKFDQPVLYLPYSFTKTQTAKGQAYVSDQIKKSEPYLSEVIHVDKPLKINSFCFSTGYLENRNYEQALVLNTERGLIVLVGCSHPGIVEIVKRAKSLIKKDVYFVMGGFHLVGTDTAQVREMADELRNITEWIAPCHCTGEKAIHIFKDVFKDDYIEIKAGFKFKIKPGKLK